MVARHHRPSESPGSPPHLELTPDPPALAADGNSPEAAPPTLARRHGAPPGDSRAAGSAARRRRAKTLSNLWRQLLRWSGLTPRDLARRATRQRIAAIDKQNQIRLLLDYRERASAGRPLPSFEDTEFRCFSQNGEDGLLLYIFALLGFRSRCAVEICAADGIQCNTANLIINHGFSALLVDGRERKIEEGLRFYEKLPETAHNLPHMQHAWVTRDTVNGLIVEAGFEGEIDLLSLDLDGVDYWIWSAIEAVRPRVVVAEYNGRFSAEKAVAVAYRDDFAWPHKPQAGASLGALVQLAARRGYRLVGCQRSRFNAFFVSQDEGQRWFPEVEPATCLGPQLLPETEQQELLAQGPWVEV